MSKRKSIEENQVSKRVRTTTHTWDKYELDSFARFGDDLCSEILKHCDMRTQQVLRAVCRQWNHVIVNRVSHLSIPWEMSKYIFCTHEYGNISPGFIQQIKKDLQYVKTLEIDVRYPSFQRQEIMNLLPNLTELKVVGRYGCLIGDPDMFLPTLKNVKFNTEMNFWDYSGEEPESVLFRRIYGPITNEINLTFDSSENYYHIGHEKGIVSFLGQFTKLKKLSFRYKYIMDSDFIKTVIKCVPTLKSLEIHSLNSDTFNCLISSSVFQSINVFVGADNTRYKTSFFLELQDQRDYYKKIKNFDFNDNLCTARAYPYYFYNSSEKISIVCSDTTSIGYKINPSTVHLVFNHIGSPQYETESVMAALNLIFLSEENKFIQHIRTREEFIGCDTLEAMAKRANNNPSFKYSVSCFNATKEIVGKTKFNNFKINLKTKSLSDFVIFNAMLNAGKLNV
jgi:hypothetical protein